MKLLVSGKMRSGTTFLANFLNSQENLVVYSDFLRSIFTNIKQLSISDFTEKLSEKQKNIFISGLEAEAALMRIPISVKRDSFSTISELFNETMSELERCSPKTIATVVGVKKTEELENISQLLKSDFKVIYIYRDPRDVVLSSLNRFAKFNIYSFVNDWQKSTIAVNRLSNDPNLFLLKYEDLILNKDEVIEQLSDFFGIPITSELDNLVSRDDNNYVHNSSFGDVTKLFDKSAVYRWKTTPYKELSFLNSVLKKELSLLGYETSDLRSLSSNFSYFLKYYRFKLSRKIRGLF